MQIIDKVLVDQRLDFLHHFDQNRNEKELNSCYVQFSIAYDAYGIYEDVSDQQCITHWPLSNLYPNNANIGVQFYSDKHSTFDAALSPKHTSSELPAESTLITKLLRIHSKTCPLFFMMSKRFKCTNVACGNELEATIHTGFDGYQITEQHDQVSLRTGHPEKCTKCRSLLDEVVEDRVVESIQFAQCSRVSNNNFKLQHAVIVALSGNLVGRLQVGDEFLVHGYAKCSIDGGFLQHLCSEPTIYIQARAIEVARMPHQLPLTDQSSPFHRIDGLLTNFAWDEVMTPLWRRLSLLLIVSYASCFSGIPVNLLIVTDDTTMVGHFLKGLPKLRIFEFDSKSANKVKSYSSRHVQGGSYTITTSSQLCEDGCLFVENLEVLKPSELYSIAENRNSGVIACCPFSAIKKASTISSEFDLVFSLENVSKQDLLAATFFIFATRGTDRKIEIEPYFTDNPLPISCEALLKEYFISSRNIIGESNDGVIFPIYNPSRQQSLGIHLAMVFQALRCSDRISRDDVFLSLVVQEINLLQRLGSSVFQKKSESWSEASMPSPCPSNNARVPVEPSHLGTGSFQSRYGFVIRDLQSQLSLL